MNIVWSDEASEDLELIYNFYFSKNKDTATKIYNSILDEIEILRQHPKIAAIEPTIQNEEYTFRSLVVFNGLFKVTYFVDKQIIYIHSVWCCRTNPLNIRQ